jgi:hypothetical protein
MVATEQMVIIDCKKMFFSLHTYLSSLESKPAIRALSRVPENDHTRLQEVRISKPTLIEQVSSKINKTVSVYAQQNIKCLSAATLPTGAYHGFVLFDKHGQMNMDAVGDYVGIILSAYFLFYEAMKLAGERGTPTKSRVLHIGLGPGNIATRLAYLVPTIESDVVEIDRAIVEMATKHFGFDRKRHSINVQDGASFVTREEVLGAYNVIIIDAYQGESVPIELQKKSFFDNVSAALKKNEISFVIVNCYQDTLEKIWKLCTGTFKFVHRLMSAKDSGNNVIVAYNRPKERVQVSSVLRSDRFSKDDKGE